MTAGERTLDGMEGEHFCFGDKSKGGVIPLHTGVAHCGSDLRAVSSWALLTPSSLGTPAGGRPVNGKQCHVHVASRAVFLFRFFFPILDLTLLALRAGPRGGFSVISVQMCIS